MKFNKFFLPLFIVLMSVNSISVRAEDDFFDNIDDISFEDLGSIVTSVSKKPESAFDAASAIYVITDEDIRRMGATNFPDALRMAPGIQVTKGDAHDWAVSSRGFNQAFANKLLVLIDGRTIYNSTFSGVYWDLHDYPLEDVKRIEVIRGPGAALWGANAVNGVINIITKRATETQGTLVSGFIGNKHIGEDGSVRYGGKVNDNVHYRVYAKGGDTGDAVISNGEDAFSERTQERAGFRIDAVAGESTKFTLQGDVYHNEIDRRTIAKAATPPPEVFHTDHSNGGNLLARWTHIFEDDSTMELQAYFDGTKKDYILLDQSSRTIDVDFQHNFMINNENDFTWGFGYRSILSEFTNSSVYTMDLTKRTDVLYSLFMQNKITVIPNKLSFTIGSKFEHNDFSGFEIQPSVRASWHTDANNVFWGAVSRAVRTPSIAEEGIELVDGPSGLGGELILIGNKDYDSEDLIAYELGYRSNINDKLSIDASVFFNDYSNTQSLSDPVIDGNDILAYAENNGEIRAYGLELLANYNVTDDLWLEGSYSFVELDFESDDMLNEEAGNSPKHQIKASINYNVTKDLEWNNMFYYSSRLEQPDIDAFVKYDSSVIWKPKQGVEFSVVGVNLLENAHAENEPHENTHGLKVEIERAVYAKATFRF